MYFININKTISDLKTETISDQGTFKYIFGMVVLIIIGFPYFHSDVVLGSILTLLGLGTALLLLNKCSKINAQYDNCHFSNRFFTVCFVISFRLSIFFILFYGVPISLAELIYPPEIAIKINAITTFFVRPVISLTLIVIWFYMIKKSFLKITTTKFRRRNSREDHFS